MLARRVWAALGKLTKDGRRRRRREIELVRQSALFQPDWYFQQYPEIARTAGDPLVDYMTRGWREGRDPGPEFGTAAYLSANPDVARSGVNPLVHFLEFGQFEGRGSLASLKKLLRPVVSFDFPDATPCASFPVAEELTRPWFRSRDLGSDRPDLLKIDGHGVAYLSYPRDRTIFDTAVDHLRIMSGHSNPARSGLGGQPVKATEKLIDAWYVNVSKLCTRWEGGSFPFVARVFQLDPSGRSALVGERLIVSALDVLELHLTNGLFPMLFVFAAPDGKFRGAQVLDFPSFCRGGVHYSEFLYWLSSASAGAAADPLLLSGERASELMSVLRCEEKPAISDVVVEVDGADGLGGLFRSDIRIWLERVGRLPIIGDAERSADQNIVETVSIRPAHCRPTDGATLIIDSDAIPTIASLTASRADKSGAADPISVALLFDQLDTSRPVYCIESPSSSGSTPASNTIGRIWPQVRSNGHGGPDQICFPAAIRRAPPKGLDDAELFKPISRGVATGDREGITWVIEPRLWERRVLSEAIQAVALQNDAERDFLALLGFVDPDVRAAVTQGFAESAQAFADFGSAVAASRSPLIGYLGPGVVLHDNDTATVLSNLLKDPKVATASCVLISTDRRGKRWHARIASGGAFRSSRRSLIRADFAFAAELLWRSSYPVEAPASDLWVGRTAQVTGWIDVPHVLGSGEWTHICTSLVTASRFGQAEAQGLPQVVPAATADRATMIGTLLG